MDVLTVSIQQFGINDKSIYNVASAWTETYINATTNTTMEQFACMRQMRYYDSSNGRDIVSERHWHDVSCFL